MKEVVVLCQLNYRLPLPLGILVATGLLLLVGGSSVAAVDDEPSRQEVDARYWEIREQLDSGFAEALNSLAQKCEELGLPQQAQATRQWLIPRDPRRSYLFLPAETDPLRPPADAERLVQLWYQHFSQYRRKRADALFRLAEQSLAGDRAARAFQLLHETLHEHPDHEAAREILGYRQVSGRWRRPTGVVKSRVMRVANPELGFSAGRYWLVESEHFSVLTNDSEVAGQALVAELENLYSVWQQLFFGYWSSRSALERRFERGVVPSRAVDRHKVVLFDSRERYLATLKRSEPLIDLTVGIYLEPQRRAFFYSGSQRDIWFHEVTHQLFSETGRVAPGTGLKSNFWIVEGVALYMESLQPMTGYYISGGVDASRLQFARYRLLTEKFYMPLEQLVQLGRRELQEHENIRRLYSQSAGLTHYLMHYRRGAYRTALVDYLQALYQGRTNDRMLAELTDTAFEQHDRQYLADLNVSDGDLRFLTRPPDAEELALGNTSVTAGGIKHLVELTKLRWLDLTATNVDDQAFSQLAGLEQLEHLVLERTKISDRSMPVIAKFRKLEILDLTSCDVTDDGLRQLTPLTGLKELWLAGTRITDAGLQHLRGLNKLETLDVNGTGVTIEGYRRLKDALPQLKD